MIALFVVGLFMSGYAALILGEHMNRHPWERPPRRLVLAYVAGVACMFVALVVVLSRGVR